MRNIFYIEYFSSIKVILYLKIWNTSIHDNNDGTFTYHYTNGFNFTTSSLIGATGRGYGLKFLRDSTVVYDSNALYVHYPQSAGFRSMTTWNFIDSPSSTSEITYKIQVGTQSAAEVSFQEGSIKSTFYLMEIAGW